MAKPSLEEFAETAPKRNSRCWVCLLPEREEIERVVAEKQITYPAVVEWLVKHRGYSAEEATISRVQYHMKSHARRSA